MFDNRVYRLFLCLPALLFAFGGSSPAQTSRPESTITIHVGKTGLFSGFGHNHTISAPIEHAAINSQSKTAVITVLTKELKVIDPDASEKDRAEIQATMLGPKVLDAPKYPQIRFTSSRIEQIGPGRFQITGKLDLHGVTKELEFPVSATGKHYTGKTKFKQTDFGIQPVSAGGGTVKVKDEVEIEFDVYE
ncbi:MAG TPA: YceI family protein [Candidatus Acidoferrales bacterium]|nr:YceI family protein [Candidatus Acidoferrales bacterium]